MNSLYIVLAIIVLILLWVVALYNKLVNLKNQVDEGWSDIDVQLKRRYDLIPNIVETVKGYASHEQGTLQKVIEARNSAMAGHSGNASLEKQAQNENMLSTTLKSIFALAESYPDLKANTNFMKLQDELSATENAIQNARRFYNGMVRDFNIAIQSFPNNLFVGMLGYTKREFFGVEDQAQRENVQVKF